MDYVGFVELVLTAEWYIWWERRQKVHGENGSFDKELYDSPEETQSKADSGGLEETNGRNANVDVAFDVNSDSGFTGVVIRDYIGQCIAASQSFLPHVVDAPLDEAYTFREGLVLAQQIGSNNFIVQTDCVQVIDTMKDGGFSATTSATIYDDCNILPPFRNIRYFSFVE
jgi:hypothetical protein